MSPSADHDCLSPAELKDLVLRLLAEVAEPRRTVAAQRDEIARLKDDSPRPNIKPAGARGRLIEAFIAFGGFDCAFLAGPCRLSQSWEHRRAGDLPQACVHWR
jgi:hypothetical protein